MLNASSADAVVTLTKPNGGEILCINQAFTIEFNLGSDPHGAIYYKTDGTQPAAAQGAGNLDPSVIKHPIQDNETTYSWTPDSSKISQTGRIWIEGHAVNHWSNNNWDQSDANFEVKDCATAGSSYKPPSQVGGTTSPISYLAFPTPLEVAASATSSLRYRFQLQGLNLERVELLTWQQTQFEQFSLFVLAATSTASLAPLQVSYIDEGRLAANTRYENRFLRGIVGSSATVPSRAFDPVYTAIETPHLSSTGVAPTQIMMSAGQISNVGVGLSGIFFTNLTTGISSGWIQSASWTLDQLDPDSTYQFIAHARNGDGKETPFSDLLTVKTPPLLASPNAASSTPVAIVPLKEGMLARAHGETAVWLVLTGGFRWHIPTPEAFESGGYRWDDVLVVEPGRLLSTRPVQLAKIAESSMVWYLTDDGRRRWVPNPGVMEVYQWKWENVRTVSRAMLESYTPVRLLRAFNDFRVWVLVPPVPSEAEGSTPEGVEPGGKRRWIVSPAVFSRMGFLWDEVAVVLPEEIAAYPEGPALP